MNLDNEVERAMDQVFLWNYTRWLTTLKIAKNEHPEAYDALVGIVREYRDWVALVSGRENLPEVPTA